MQRCACWECHASVLIYFVDCVSQSLMQASSCLCIFGLKAMCDHLTPLKHHCFHDSLCVAWLTRSSMKYGCSFPIYQQNTQRLQTPPCFISPFTFFMFLAFLKSTCGHWRTSIKLPINIC